MSASPLTQMPRVHADDVGTRPEVNDAVAELLQGSVLRSVSVQPNSVSTASAAALLGTYPEVEVHLHVTLTEGRPLTPLGPTSGLVDDRGVFLRPAHLVRNALLGRVSRPALREEVDAQVERLQDLGLVLSGLDSHHHVHAFSPIADVVSDVASACGMAVRSYASLVAQTPRGRAKKLLLAGASAISHLVSAGRLGMPPSWSHGGPRYVVASWEGVRAELGLLMVCHPGGTCDRFVDPSVMPPPHP